MVKLTLNSISIKDIKDRRFVKNKVIMSVIAILLFFLIGEYGAIRTGVNDIYIYLQYPFFYLFAASYGAWPGLIVGLVGHLLIDITRQDMWFSWITASGLMGFIIGKVSERKRNKAEKDQVRLLRFFIICAGTIVSVFGLYVPIFNIVIYHMGVKEAFSQAIFAALSDAIITLLVVHAFYFSYKSPWIRRVISLAILINSLLLISYGNKGLGSLIVYIAAMIVCIISFMHSLVDINLVKSKYRVPFYIMVVFLLFIVILFAFLFLSGHVKKPVGDEKIAIVLGAGLAGDKPNSVLKKRLDKAAEYALNNPDIVIITSGGQGRDEVIPEALAMKNYLLEKGVDADRIYMEDKSTTTQENFRYSLQLMKELGYDNESEIVIITNDFHCFRSSKYAESEGYENITTLPASTPLVLWLPNYIREGMALVKYAIKIYL